MYISTVVFKSARAVVLLSNAVSVSMLENTYLYIYMQKGCCVTTKLSLTKRSVLRATFAPGREEDE